MSEDNPLLLAVEDLTKPRNSKVVQQNEAGITCTSPVELPSLLDQLELSIQSSMGGSMSGASLAFEGAPLNTAALFEAMKITSQIGSWCHSAKVVATRQPAVDLKAWYVATLAINQSEQVVASRIKQLGNGRRQSNHCSTGQERRTCLTHAPCARQANGGKTALGTTGR